MRTCALCVCAVCARRQPAKAHILRDSEQEERQASPSPVGNVIASKAAAEEHTALLARLKQDLVVLQGVYEQRCAVSRTQYCDRTSSIPSPRTTLHSRHHVSMCVYLLGVFFFRHGLHNPKSRGTGPELAG